MFNFQDRRIKVFNFHLLKGNASTRGQYFHRLEGGIRLQLILHCCDQMSGLILSLIFLPIGPLDSALLLRRAWAELCMCTDSSTCLVSALENWPMNWNVNFEPSGWFIFKYFTSNLSSVSFLRSSQCSIALTAALLLDSLGKLNWKEIWDTRGEWGVPSSVDRVQAFWAQWSYFLVWLIFWIVELLKCWIIELLNCSSGEVLKYWIVGLLDCLILEY